MSKSKVALYFLRVSLLFAAYFITARIGLSLGAVSGFATLVWPPTGISLAALLVYGYRVWPGIFLAAFLVNFSVGASLFVALGIAAGNTFGPLAAAYLYKRFGKGDNNIFGSLRQVLSFIFFGGILSTMISASIGSNSLLIGSEIEPSAYGSVWAAWWIGDALGILLVAPLVLTWWNNWRIPRLEPNKRAEAWLVFISVILVSMLAFWDILRDGLHNFPASISYLIFPPLVWAALRFSPRLAMTAIAILSALSIWGTMNGFGPFETEVVSRGLLYLQIYIGTTIMTIMVLIGVVSERKTAEGKLEILNNELEERVKKRTFELRRAQEILDHSFEGVMIANGTQEHLIQYVNPAWEDLTGWKKEEVVGKVAPRILKSGKMTLEFYKNLWSTILKGNLFSAQITNKRKDGSLYEAEINIFRIKRTGDPDYPDYPDYYVEVSRDITEHKRMEQQLAEYTESLEAMVANRTKELEEKVADLEKLNKFMVGRELKMIELKDEIVQQSRMLEELRNKIPVHKPKPAKRIKK